ncbi:hypothetical protein DFJ58DRAFT_812360 [Suillus subalutaceus]|uniref:uncharacterized protein n=1 Tax=Suillus subalutaceus TaxID=48586 RepID=UPI001B884DEA|nr:uncharacterized protein DFJ58DRAFT_812360 [Suillus subalutaceus]KAG1839409.1 hypothetical protein DFJ58DRAFT_812360 [Suillus subalutaceus]
MLWIPEPWAISCLSSDTLLLLASARAFHLFGQNDGYIYAPTDHCKDANPTHKLQSHWRRITMARLRPTYIWMQFQNLVVEVSLIRHTVEPQVRAIHSCSFTVPPWPR